MLQNNSLTVFSARIVTLAFLTIAFLTGAVSDARSQSAQLVKIPDPQFLTYLKEKIPAAFTGNEMNIKSPEVLMLTRINVINKDIFSFEGIGYFTALEEFNCTYNEATTLDVSKNTKLKSLVCWENALTSLDLSKNEELVELNCGDNKITSLNISKNLSLRELYCEQNQLAALDVSTNNKLRILYCNSNKLTALNLSKNTLLERLECMNNPLVSVTKNNMLVEIPDQNFRKWLQEKIPNAFAGKYLNSTHNNVIYLNTIEVAAKGIVSLQGIEYFKGLKKLDCQGNKLSSLDVSKNTELTGLNFEGNPLAFLDLRGMRQTNYLTDLSANTTITSLKLHRKLRDDARIIAMKQKRGRSLIISVFGAAAGSADYILINSNDIPARIDNRYRNNS